MKVLVTGAGGFIGSHLTERLVREGYDVRAFVHYNSTDAWGWLEGSPEASQVEVLAGDIRDSDSVYAAFAGCDAVLHLAALIGIPYSYVSPLAYVRTNVEGTYNVLQAARMHKVSQVLITSTSETYGTAQYVPIDEHHPAVGQSPYAASKIGADQLALSFHRSFGLPVKIVRPFNTYGPRQSSRAVIPTVVSQILEGKREIRLGNLAPTRDLTFVEDTAAGFIAVLRSDRVFGEATNIGMNEEIAIGDLARMIVRMMGAGADIVADEERERPEKSEVGQLRCDNRKALSATEWRPSFTLESGLEKTVAWMRDHRQYYKVDRYNV